MRLFVLSFVLGAWWLQREAALPEWNALLLSAAPLLALHLRWFSGGRVRAALLLAAGALCGCGYGAWRAEVRLADALPHEWEGRDIEVTGVIASLPQEGERGTRFTFEVEGVATQGARVPPVVSLTWYAARWGGEGLAPPKLAAGERWRFTLRLKRPRGLANPHGFDFEPWALERGIRATGYVRAKSEAQRLAERVDGWPYTLHRWRGGIRDTLRARLGQKPFVGVLVALVIGDQDAISADDWRTFWRTGVGHLMSISGLHITMLAGLAMAVAIFAWVRVPGLALFVPARKAGVVAAVLAASAYSLIAGYAVPAQRTFVMLAAIAACVLFDRHGSPSRVLAVAALCVLAVDPWAVLAPGFWLSFGAVAGIFYVLSLRTGTVSRLRGAAAEQLAVTLVMFPMLVALFQEVSLVSPLANALAIPVVSLIVVPLSLVGAFLDLASLLDAAHWLVEALMVPLEWLASLPGAMLESHAPEPWTVVAAVIGCAWLLAPRGFPLRPAGAIWVAPLFLVVPAGPASGEAWIDVLDVGNGLAVVVRTASHALVYDTGPSWSAESDSGSRIVVPHLRGEGVRRLDGVIVSHADDDHAGGAASVAAARRPGWLLSSLAPENDLHMNFTLSKRCQAGDRWSWDGVRFDVLHPGMEAYADLRRHENDRSCVLRIETAAASMLLTGDVEARSEIEMRRRDADALRSDVLLVPHHGSRTSSTAEFLDAVAPKVAVASIGYRNRFRHPNEKVVARYSAHGIEMRRTDREGALRIVLPAGAGEPPSIRGCVPPPRYWSERDCPERFPRRIVSPT